MPRSHLLMLRPQVMGSLLEHPEQLRAFKIVESLIKAVRHVKKEQEYYIIQRELFDVVYAAQKKLEEANRNMKREQDGKSVPPPLLDSWSRDRSLWDRIQHQFRSVGDALAWRRLGFDRRYILAYSRNEDPGPMAAAGKSVGLQAEIGAVVRCWRDDGRLALMHDLTNCLSIGDISIFGGPTPDVQDVKRDPNRKPDRPQLKRMRDTLEFFAGRGPLRGPSGEYEEFVSKHQFKTRFDALANGLRLAQADGLSSIYLAHGWVLDCYVGLSQIPEDRRGPIAKRLKDFEARKRRTHARAGVDKTAHVLKAMAVGELGVSPALAPPTIFPLTPTQCAMLTCDLAAYLPVMSWEMLAEAFRSVGFTARCPLRAANETLASEDEVLVATLGTRRLGLNANAFGQIALELVDPPRYAGALKEAVIAGTSPGRGILTFANEKATWR